MLVSMYHSLMTLCIRTPAVPTTRAQAASTALSRARKCYVPTRAHACMRAHTHTHTRARTLTQKHANTYTRTLVCASFLADMNAELVQAVGHSACKSTHPDVGGVREGHVPLLVRLRGHLFDAHRERVREGAFTRA
jgi:hypothetical protein